LKIGIFFFEKFLLFFLASKTKTTVSADPLNREKLAQVRVMQKNLVFVVGLSTTLADEKILRKGPYFGNKSKF